MIFPVFKNSHIWFLFFLVPVFLTQTSAGANANTGTVRRAPASAPSAESGFQFKENNRLKIAQCYEKATLGIDSDSYFPDLALNYKDKGIHLLLLPDGGNKLHLFDLAKGKSGFVLLPDEKSVGTSKTDEPQGRYYEEDAKKYSLETADAFAEAAGTGDNASSSTLFKKYQLGFPSKELEIWLAPSFPSGPVPTKVAPIGAGKSEASKIISIQENTKMDETASNAKLENELVRRVAYAISVLKFNEKEDDLRGLGSSCSGLSSALNDLLRINDIYPSGSGSPSTPNPKGSSK